MKNYFKTQELVPQNVYKEQGENAINNIDKNALIALNNIREILNVPLTCNNWHIGGNRNYSGYRDDKCTIGASKSQHKIGCAFDLISNKMTAKEMRKILKENQNKIIIPIRIEEKDKNGNEISWLHIDTKYTGKKLYFFIA